MNIHAIYQFKLVKSTNETFRYHKKFSSYDLFYEIRSLKLQPVNTSNSVKKCRIKLKNQNSILVNFINPKFGLGIIEGREDVFLIKNTQSQFGYLQIIVIKDMRPYAGIAIQLFINGSLRPQIKALKNSFIQ